MGRSLCDFCNKESVNLKLHTEHGVNYTICNECYTKVSKHQCIECGRSVDDEMSVYKGRCIASCAQRYMAKEEAEKREIELGINTDNEALYDSEDGEIKLRFTKADYEKWLTFNPDNRGFNENDFRQSMLLRRIWIMMKLTAAGYTDTKSINENMTDIEELLEKNIDKIIGQKCKFRIFNGKGDKKALYLGEVLAHKGKVYIYEDLE